MSKEDLVSIIVPAYNLESYIADCLESITKQSYKNLEIILVNDGSTDNTLEIISEYARKDDRIKVIDQSNAGVSGARNAGLALATGDFVAFIDGDDMIDGAYVATLLSTLRKTGAEIAKCNVCHFSDSRLVRSVKTARSIKLKNPQDSLLGLLYCTGTGRGGGPGAKLYAANVVLSMQFDTTLTHEEDFDFIFRATEKVEGIATVNYAGYMYRKRPGSAIQSGFRPNMLLSLERRMRELSEVTKVQRAQKANLSLNAMCYMALINDRTSRFRDDKNRLWEIAKSTRGSAILDCHQRFDHKIVTAVSYLGQRVLVKFVRILKRIRLEEER